MTMSNHEKKMTEEINKYRKLLNLPTLKIKERKCLKCNTKFTSTNSRLCEECNKINLKYAELSV